MDDFGLTEVLLLMGGIGVIVAVFARKYGFGQGWANRDHDDDPHN